MNPKAPTALIIEDDVSISLLFSRAFQEGGFETQAIHDGQVAIEQVVALAPDIILLDLHLPNVSGEQILRHIQNTPALNQTKVIAVSADSVLAGWLHERADFVFVKPVSYKDLRRISRRLRESFV